MPNRPHYNAIRRRVYELLAQARPDDPLSHTVDLVIMSMILLSAVAITLESMESLHLRFGGIFNVAELVFVAIFSIEYLLRIWSAADNPAFNADGARARLRYALSPLAIIDLVAVLPFYFMAFGVITSSSYMLVLKSVRLLRVLKLTRYSSSFSILSGVVRDNVHALTAAFFLLMIVMLIAASGIYIFEREAQPVAFGSIPAAMWWAFATLTTVGYGDVTPITAGGRVFGASITVVGVGMVALPTAILASAFSEQLRLRSQQYLSKVDTALEDGIVSLAEKRELEALRKALGISSESAERILATEFAKFTHASDVSDHICPHCNLASERPFDDSMTRDVLPLQRTALSDSP